jgi:hypothetical protein
MFVMKELHSKCVNANKYYIILDLLYNISHNVLVFTISETRKKDNMFKTHRTYELTTGVKNNTIAVIAEIYSTKVIYHKTVVFTLDHKPKDKITLRNGGWDTISTRLVINRALEQCESHFRIERKVIKKQRYTVLVNQLDGTVLPFVNGMVLL